VKNYYIIGCGGLAKEVYTLTSQTLANSNHFKGFIDLDNSNEVIIIGNENFPIINQVEFLKRTTPSKKNELYIGVGNPIIIDKISKLFTNYNFPNLIHPNVIYDVNSVKLGRGNILTAGCILTVDISLGSFNYFNLTTTVGHDVIIGDNNVFNPGVNISGSVKIGSSNLFGTNSTILQTLKIENNNIIGASSLLTKSINSDNIMLGVPAKKKEL
jgi:sugar O-acyltransferase (sialic acid O-acetyltransferase NeuD family)